MIHKPCTHSKVFCGLYRGTREFAHHAKKNIQEFGGQAEHFIREYGEPIGQVAQGIAPALTAAYPIAGPIVGSLGKGIETYAHVRNEIG